MWTPSPTVLLERYGVTARQVFATKHSPSGLRSHSSSLVDLPPLMSSRTAGTQSLSSFDFVDDEDATDRSIAVLSSGREGGSPYRSNFTPSPPKPSLSVGELKKICFGGQATLKKREKKNGRGLAASDSSLRSRRLEDVQTGAIGGAKNPAGQGGSRPSSSRPLSSGSKRDSQLSAVMQRLSTLSKKGDEESDDQTETEETDSSYETESESETGNEQSWGGGGVKGPEQDPLGPLGGVRQARKKKPANPFKVYEDREQRLQLERHWLMTSDNSNRSYLATRMRDMRLDAVASRRTRDGMSAVELYEDTVYFGQYSTELKALIKQKEEKSKKQRKAHIFGREDMKLLRQKTGIGGDIFTALEAHEQMKTQKKAEKTPKHRADKNATCQEAVTLQRLQSMLQESGHRVERAHDLVP
mmetsp:Transcript_111351/g.208871  ORF Transcript_111351/g.208871 Transcript_111351/m.208871 type:complete len:414 (+) Transcript_111351:168-1409(+)